MSLETPNAFADEENILLHTALFKQVSPAEAEELLPHLKHATFDKGDYIFSEAIPISACIYWSRARQADSHFFR